jgi:hypothetical protein
MLHAPEKSRLVDNALRVPTNVVNVGGTEDEMRTEVLTPFRREVSHVEWQGKRPHHADDVDVVIVDVCMILDSLEYVIDHNGFLTSVTIPVLRGAA